ncbi:piggyBac transposable element-derived protein 2 [Trichonephila clavipes]|nr:piggyBac transposable element-derived protein 2 [Trichonephila clavipes]
MRAIDNIPCYLYLGQMTRMTSKLAFYPPNIPTTLKIPIFGGIRVLNDYFATSEIDKLTDEEGFDDTETLDASVRHVAGSIEISVPYENHDDHRQIYQTKVKMLRIRIKYTHGSHDFYLDVKNKITAVKWNDNKCVILATNFDIIEPLTSVSRGEKGKAEKNKINQPCLVNNYNRNMGGVDSHNWLLEKHTIKIREKKWYWLILTRIVDMAFVNTCVICNMVNAEKKRIKEIRRHIAIAYLKKGNTVQKQIGRPSYTMSSRVKKIDTVRRDGVGQINGKRKTKMVSNAKLFG